MKKYIWKGPKGVTPEIGEVEEGKVMENIPASLVEKLLSEGKLVEQVDESKTKKPLKKE